MSERETPDHAKVRKCVHGENPDKCWWRCGDDGKIWPHELEDNPTSNG